MNFDDAAENSNNEPAWRLACAVKALRAELRYRSSLILNEPVAALLEILMTSTVFTALR
jgi:hypothetical protein